MVLVGSSENNRELYYELTNQDWTGFRVKGYFDFEPNPKFPQECPYLGKPQDVKEYLEKERKHALPVLLSAFEGACHYPLAD